jgi:hypothetical protein
MNEGLRQELRAARLHVATSSISEAKRHLRVAATIVESARPGSLSRDVLSHIQETGFAIEHEEMRFATWAIDQATLSLDAGETAEEG